MSNFRQILLWHKFKFTNLNRGFG